MATISHIVSKLVNEVGKPKRSSRWPTFRKLHLVRFPTCAACGGTDALEPHHIVPYHVAPERELDPQNCLTLCEKGPFGNCHLIVGHNGYWKDWNPNCEATASHTLAAIKSIQSAKGRPTPK